jgi:serine/threonine-protein kinase RsbW
MQSLDTFRIALPARYNYLLVISATIEAILTRMEGAKATAETIYQLQLAAHELCNNVIEHAYGHETGQLEVVITLVDQPPRFIFDLYDTGAPFDATTVVDPDLDQPQVGGYGLFLARQLSDELHYERVDARNHWQLIKALD